MSFDVHAQQVLLGTTENNLRIKRNLVLEFMLVFKLSHVVTYPAPKLTLLDFGGLVWMALCAPPFTTVEVKEPGAF